LVVVAWLLAAGSKVSFATPPPPNDSTTTSTTRPPEFPIPDPPYSAWVEPSHLTVRPNTPFTFEVHDCNPDGGVKVWPYQYLSGPRFFVDCVPDADYTGPAPKGLPGIATVTVVASAELGPHAVTVEFSCCLIGFPYDVSDDPSVPIPPYFPRPPFTATLTPNEITTPPNTPYTITVSDCLADTPFTVNPTGREEDRFEVDCVATGYTGPQDGAPGSASFTLTAPSTPGQYGVSLFLDPVELDYLVTVTDEPPSSTSPAPTTMAIANVSELPSTGGSRDLAIVALVICAGGAALARAARRPVS